MKQFFKLSIILLALLCSTAPLADAKVKKSKSKAKTTASTSKWIEVARSNIEVYYVSPEYKLQVDDQGYPIVTVKCAPLKSYLDESRRKKINISGNPNFKNYTHTIQQWKVDVNLMRLMIYTSAFYANNNLISIENYAANPEWTDYTYNSVGYKIAEVVRYAVKGY